MSTEKEVSTETDVSTEAEASTEIEMKFTDFQLRESIHQSIVAAGYERPTPVQAKCIPPGLEGKDVIGLAQTGTGKTAAFAIPIIQRLADSMDLGAVVLAPTRELAQQTTAMFNMLGANSGIRVATLVGGLPMDDDVAALRSWPNVIVATPGRLLDHVENEGLSLAEVQILAVDEADRMHDMGFMPQLRRIFSALPDKRQTMMFTATLDDDVERIARKSMHKPVRIQIGVTAPAHRAEQELFELGEDEKTPMLMKLLKKSTGRVLVFSRTKRGVDRLYRIVCARRFKAVRIHGDMEQVFRDRSLGEFRDGTSPILIATDIAARGLDVSDIEHVINYDFPHNSEDYVHRIGRTARVDASGQATSFITRADKRFVIAVRKLIGDKLPEPTRLESYKADSHHSTHKHKHGPKSHGRRGKGNSGKRRTRGAK